MMKNFLQRLWTSFIILGMFLFLFLISDFSPFFEIAVAVLIMSQFAGCSQQSSIISDETETIQINSQQNTVTYDIDALPDEETASAVAYQIFVGMKTTHNFVPQKVVYDEGTECWRVSLWEANGDIWTDGEDCTIILQKKDGKMLDIIWGE